MRTAKLQSCAVAVSRIMAGQDDARLLARSAVYLWCSESSSSSAMNSAVSSLSSNPGDLTVRQMPSYYDYVCRGMQDLDKSNDSSSAEEGCSLPSSHPETGEPCAKQFDGFN